VFSIIIKKHQNHLQKKYRQKNKNIFLSLVVFLSKNNSADYKNDVKRLCKKQIGG
jgi:hypothetical protein